MRECRASRASSEEKAKNNAYKKAYRQSKNTAEERAKNNAYIRTYRQSKIKAEERAKHNAYQKAYRQSKNTAEERAKKNAYQNTYRQSKNVSSEERAKKTAYMRSHRGQVKKDIQFFITKFHDVVSRGPLYICTCCDQLWYKHSVVCADKLRQSNPHVQKFLCSKTSFDGNEWLCNTCNSHLLKGKVPPCAVVNGMVFPEKPPFFDLNELECRLLAPRIAFQKLMQAPRGKQFKIHGNIVNVPADVTSTVTMLPRLPSQNATVKVNLKRKLQYKSSALSLNVRPQKIIEAAFWLICSCSLYKDEGIVLNSDWVNSYNAEMPNENADNISEHCDSEQSDGNGENVETKESDNEDEWSEDEAEIPAGTLDTMLTAPNFVEDNERQHILNVAPAEGNRPMSVFSDKYSEELAYPGIFLGQPRKDNKDRWVKVHYSDVCKSELRRSDRRAAMCVENIFYKTKKVQMKILLGKSNIALRKCKGNRRSLNAGHLKQDGALDGLLRHNEGFKFLTALRGSPPYFEKAKKDLFAMIRQLGPATLFCSFSSAETKWIHLLRILGQLVDHKQYNDDELET